MIRKEDIKFETVVITDDGMHYIDSIATENNIADMEDVPAITEEWFEAYMSKCSPEDRSALERLKTAWDEDPYVD